MKHGIFTVRDAKSEVFGRPFFQNTIGTAVRSFEDEANRAHEENIIYNHPGDFALFQLGEFDDSDGTFTTIVPKMIVQASEVKKMLSGPTKISKV